jgi:hypothetical protein
MRSGGVQRHHAVSDRVSLDAGADLAHLPGAEIADHVGHLGQLPRRASQQVTTHDADRLGIDYHDPSGHCGSGTSS